MFTMFHGFHLVEEYNRWKKEHRNDRNSWIYSGDGGFLNVYQQHGYCRDDAHIPRTRA